MNTVYLLLQKSAFSAFMSIAFIACYFIIKIILPDSVFAAIVMMMTISISSFALYAHSHLFISKRIK